MQTVKSAYGSGNANVGEEEPSKKRIFDLSNQPQIPEIEQGSSVTLRYNNNLEFNTSIAGNVNELWALSGEPLETTTESIPVKIDD